MDFYFYFIKNYDVKQQLNIIVSDNKKAHLTLSTWDSKSIGSAVSGG